MTRLLYCLVAMTWALSGCTFWQDSSPELKLLTAQKTFTRTVNALALARENGAFTKEQSAAITTVIHEAHGYLDAWADAELAGEPAPDAIAGFQAALNKLQSYQTGVTP